MMDRHAPRQVWLFPGHGAQYVGMGLALAREHPGARRWLERAEQACGQPLRRLLERGPAAALAAPLLLEPALAAVACGWVDWLRGQGKAADAVAGYSAGELPALYAAGVLDADAVLQAACLRGQALARLAAERPGGMLAVNGLCRDELATLLDRAAPVWVAAWHGPRSATLAGSNLCLVEAGRRLRGASAQVSHLAVAGPWHCPLASPASSALRLSLATLALHEPRTEVWPGSLGERCDDPLLLRQSLADSVSLPVRWQRLVDGLMASGACEFTEVGPGGTLHALLAERAEPVSRLGAVQGHGSSGPAGHPAHPGIPSIGGSSRAPDRRCSRHLLERPGRWPGLMPARAASLENSP